MTLPNSKSFSIQSPDALIEACGGNKQKLLQLVQRDPSLQLPAVLAGMKIDRIRSAAQLEQAPQQTVAQQVFAPRPPMQQGAPAGLATAPQSTPLVPPPRPAAPVQAPVAQMGEGGLAALPLPADMYDEQSFSGGGIVAFSEGGRTENRAEDQRVRGLYDIIQSPNATLRQKTEARMELQRILGTPPRVPAPIDPSKDPGRAALSPHMLAQAQDERSTLALPASSSETLAQRMHKLMAPSPGPHDYASLLAAAGPGFSLDLPTRQFDPSRLPMDPRSGHTPAQLEALGFAAPSSVEQLQAFQRMLGTPPRVPAPIDPIKDPGRVALSQLPMDNSGYSPAQLASMEASTRPKDMPLGLHMLFTGPGNFLFRKPGEGGTDILSREGGPSVGAAQAAPSDSNTPYNLPSAPLGIPADPPASPSGLAAPFARPVHPLNLKSSRTAPWPGDPPRATRAATPGTARAVPPKPDSAPPATTASSPPPADDEDAPPPFDQESSFANLLKLYGPAPKMAKTSDEARAKERNDDIGMALLSAGAKGLASRSPTFLGSLGAAAEGAIPALADSAKERKAREREDRQSDFEQQKTEYGARTQAATATMEEKRAMRANDISLKQLRLQRATLEETTRNNKAQLEGEKERNKQALDIAYAQIAAGQKNFGDREVAILTAGSKPGATPDQVYAAAAVRELISASNPFGQYGTTPAALKTVEEGLVKQLSIATRAGIPTASIEAELADVRAKLKGVLSPTKGNSVDYGALK